MRALALLTLVLAGCSKAPAPPTPEPTTVPVKAAVQAKALEDPAAELKRLTKAQAELSADLQTRLHKLDEMKAEWESLHSARLADADSDAERAEAAAENDDFQEQNERTRSELRATYEPILVDLEARLVDAAAQVKVETDRFEGK
jgi:Skp family chaperone for outer membrane proteins